MSAVVPYPHLSTGSDGAVFIGRTRYKVIHLAAEHYHYGWSAEEILQQHPDLRPEEVYSALTWFYDHYDEIVAQLKSTAQEVEDSRPTGQLSRYTLLKRKQSKAP